MIILNYIKSRLWLLIIFQLFSSCNYFLAKTIYGINRPHSIDSEKLAVSYLHSEFDLIQNYSCLGFYRNRFYDSLLNIQIDSQYLFTSFIQPLSAMYFDNRGYLKSILINCYATPKGRNLSWNDSNRLCQFPPKSHTHKYNKLKFDLIAGSIIPITGSVFESNEFDYTVVINWGFFMNRQAKIFLKGIKENISVGYRESIKIQVILINNDNFFNKYSDL